MLLEQGADAERLVLVMDVERGDDGLAVDPGESAFGLQHEGHVLAERLDAREPRCLHDGGGDELTVAVEDVSLVEG